MELTVSNQNNLPIQMGKNLPLTALGARMVQFINAGNSHELSRFKAELTVAEAMKDGNLIQTCYREEPKETIEIICYLIIEFANAVNVGKNISDGQVDDIAFLLCTRFKDLKLEELVIIFSNAKAGIYGKMFDRLDITVISDFIQQYQTGERASYLEKANHYKSFKENSILDAIVNTEDPDNPKVKKAQSLLQNFLADKKEDSGLKYTATAPIPKHSDYLEKVKNAIPEFSLKELNKFRKYAVRSNWQELIEIIDEEINKKSEG